MEFEQALDIVSEAMIAHSGSPLSDAEINLLRGTWQGQTYEQMAELYGYSANYLRCDIGNKFWKRLSQAIGESVSKTNFRAALERRSRKSEGVTTGLEPMRETRVSWSEAIDVSLFFGRTAELDLLKQWIVQDHCRLVALLGMGGIGKTALSVKLADQIHHQFDHVVWRSLRNAPPLEALLRDLVLVLSDQQDTGSSRQRLMYWLQASRCLVVLDNVETLLQPGAQAGCYRTGYEDYGDLFHLIAESTHQSCLVLTSREKPTEVAASEGILVRSLLLSGAIETALGVIETKGLIGTDDQKRELCNRYGCSPLALKIVASSIQDLFEGEIAPFLAEEMVFSGVRRLLDQQFDRLTELEQSVMYWLMINREWTSIGELVADIVPVVSKPKLLEALESLSWRSLIEKQAGSYTQQPVVMEYVRDRFTHQIATELITKKLRCFNQFSLLKTTSKDYVRACQTQLILVPVLEEICHAVSQSSLLQQLQNLLNFLQNNPVLASGYGAGNLINLCCHLHINLREYDFSNLAIRHAYLQNTSLHYVNLSHASFIKPVFTQAFSAIFAVAFNSDATLLAMGSANGEIYIWQVTDRQIILTIKGHAERILSIQFSADNAFLASSSGDRTVKVWDAQTGQLLKTLEGHSDWVWSVAYSVDRRLIASGSSDRTVKIWDTQTGQCLATLAGHTDSVRSVAFHPQGTLIASGSSDCTVKLWKMPTKGQPEPDWVQSIHHTCSVFAVAFSPDGMQLASGCHDGTLRLWNPADGQCLSTLEGHSSWVRSLTWSANHLLVSGSDDGTVRLWQPQTGQCLKTLQGHLNQVLSVASRPEAGLIASSSDDCTVRLWDTRTRQCLSTLQGYNNWVRAIAWSPDGHLLASGNGDCTVKLWNLATGTCFNTLQGHENQVLSVALSPDGKILASGSDDCTIKLWEAQTGRLLTTLTDHSSWVRSVAFSPDGTTLVSGSSDHTVKLWNGSTTRAIDRVGVVRALRIGALLKTLEGHTDWVWSVAYSPTGTLVASSGGDCTIKLWDADTDQLLETLSGHTDWVRSIAFSPDGLLLASSSSDHTIKLWRIGQIQPMAQLQHTLHGHTAQISSVAFSPDGSLLASGSNDHTVRLWDTRTRKLAATLTGHRHWVFSVAFSPQGLLASSSADGTIRIWNVTERTCLQVLKSDRPYEGTDITGAKGLTEAQKATLYALGAIGS